MNFKNVLMSGFSLYIFSVLITNYLAIFKNPPISDATLNDVLNIVLVFTGIIMAMAGYGIYRIVYERLEKEIAEQNRHFTETQVLKNLGILWCRIFEERLMDAEFHEENAEICEGLEKKDKAKKLRKKAVLKREKGGDNLETAIEYAEKALDCAEKLKDKERNEIVILWCQNNLAYYLARRWEYYQNEWEYKCGSKEWKFNLENNKEKFKEYLLSNGEIKRNYITDKKRAKRYINDVETKRYHKSSRFVKEFEDTREWVERIFNYLSE